MENEELELGREVRITKKGDKREGQVGRVNGKSYKFVPVEAKK